VQRRNSKGEFLDHEETESENEVPQKNEKGEVTVIKLGVHKREEGKGFNNGDRGK